MAYGLQVFNAAGRLIVDYSDRLVRFVSYGTITANSSGYANVSVSGMANNDTWGVALGELPFIFQYNNPPNVSFVKQSGNLRINAPAGSTVDYYVFRS
jgi:hypothetical protein|tara:strand:+ start:406 stop:699 length:294 start_codon:yes stop_codon:yes gene_type:complete